MLTFPEMPRTPVGVAVETSEPVPSCPSSLRPHATSDPPSGVQASAGMLHMPSERHTGFAAATRAPPPADSPNPAAHTTVTVPGDRTNPRGDAKPLSGLGYSKQKTRDWSGREFAVSYPRETSDTLVPSTRMDSAGALCAAAGSLSVTLHVYVVAGSVSLPTPRRNSPPACSQAAVPAMPAGAHDTGRVAVDGSADPARLSMITVDPARREDVVVKVRVRRLSRGVKTLKAWAYASDIPSGWFMPLEVKPATRSGRAFPAAVVRRS
mmetsp:Transcript_12925/g.29868  ORF Transcript_12925/g.29868 Transcript_12925/m.29868 type:complete len:266 (-) Transcript_12925:5948-6745(-)